MSRRRDEPDAELDFLDGSLDALARRCFEAQALEEEEILRAELADLDGELAALKKKKSKQTDDLHGCGCLAMAVVGLLLVVVVPGLRPMLGFAVGLVALAIWIASRPGREESAIRAKVRATREVIAASRQSVEPMLRAYREGQPDEVRAVRVFAINDFRERIERQRARTLGSGSEWGQARDRLLRHRDEAQRSVAYWRERRREEPGHELSDVNLKVAEALDAKLEEAVGRADARADVLRRFYNDCEAKLKVLDRRSRDVEETRRLAELSDRADMEIEAAESVIETIARDFLREAAMIEWALAGADKAGVQSLASGASMENIESLADQIINASERQSSEVKALSRKLAE